MYKWKIIFLQLPTFSKVVCAVLMVCKSIYHEITPRSSLFPAGRLQNKERYKNITADEGTIQIRVL